MTRGSLSVIEALKDLDGLSSYAMLTLCERWLRDPGMRTHLNAHDLGIAIRARLREVYRQLAELRAPHLGFELRQLEHTVDKPRSELDALATRLHDALAARTAREPDAATAARYRELQIVLFPKGPDSLASLSQRMSGSAELHHGPENSAVTRLQSVPVTNHTLAEAYRVWATMEETIEQRRHARTRTHPLLDTGSRLYKSTKRAREQWLRTARALFTAIPLLPVSEPARSELLASLERSVIDITAQAYKHDSDTLDQHTMPDFPRPEFDHQPQLINDDGEDDTLDFDPSDIEAPDDVFVTH